MKGKLCELRRGEVSRIVSLTTKGAMRRRLRDLGFSSGTTVRCLGTAPLGDPIAYEIMGTVIALRKEDASQIQITIEEDPWD